MMKFNDVQISQSTLKIIKKYLGMKRKQIYAYIKLESWSTWGSLGIAPNVIFLIDLTWIFLIDTVEKNYVIYASASLWKNIVKK